MTRPDASTAAATGSAQSAASDEALAQLSEIGAGLAKQALETGQMVLANGRAVDMGPGDILRCAQWAAQLTKPKRKSNTVVTPKENFLPPTA